MRKILHEPLFHFLLIGAALFLLFNQFNGAESREDTIVIDDSDIDRFINSWQMQWQRPPTQSELNHLVSQHLRQEVYYREALKMQLDHNDEIVKRRLHQKMEFLMDDIAEIDSPTEEELKGYYQANKDKYLLSPRITLQSIYFNPDKRDDALSDAQSALEELDAGALPENLGDANFVPGLFEYADEAEISRLMGKAFTEEVMALEVGSWQGPVKSGYGVHLVLVTERTESQEPEWEVVRGKVTADFVYERQEKYNESIYEGLQKNYKVVFDFEGEYRDSLNIEQP